MQQVQTTQVEKKTWGDHVAESWAAIQADLTKVAAPVLFISFVITTAAMTPGDWSLNKVVFIIVQIFLDFAGAGLLIMSDQGEKPNRFYRGFGILLIGLTIISAILAALLLLVPSLSDFIGNVNSILLVVRSIVSIIYGVIMHKEHAKQERKKKALSLQEQQAVLVAEANDQLALENQKHLAEIKSQMNLLAQTAIDYDRLAQTLLPALPQPTIDLPPNVVNSEQLQMVIQEVETRILGQLQEVISLMKETQIASPIPEEIEGGNSQEISTLIQPPNSPQIEKELEQPIPPSNKGSISGTNSPSNTTGIEPGIDRTITTPITLRNSSRKEPDQSLDWEEVIAKFPDVIEWRSSGLKSVTTDQIIKVTGYTKQKIGRAKLPAVRGGNKRINDVLNWLKKEPGIAGGNSPVIAEEIEGANSTPISQGIEGEITPENSPQIGEEIEEENSDQIQEQIEEEIATEKTEELEGKEAPLQTEIEEEIIPENTEELEGKEEEEIPEIEPQDTEELELPKQRITSPLTWDEQIEKEIETDPDLVAIGD